MAAPLFVWDLSIFYNFKMLLLYQVDYTLVNLFFQIIYDVFFGVIYLLILGHVVGFNFGEDANIRFGWNDFRCHFLFNFHLSNWLLNLLFLFLLDRLRLRLTLDDDLSDLVFSNSINLRLTLDDLIFGYSINWGLWDFNWLLFLHFSPR